VYEHTIKSLVRKRKKIKYTLSSVQDWHSAKHSLSSVIQATLGKVYFKNIKAIFVECLSVGTRQSYLCRVPAIWHSTKYIFKLKKLCRVPDRGHLAKYFYITSINPSFFVPLTHSLAPAATASSPLSRPHRHCRAPKPTGHNRRRAPTPPPRPQRRRAPHRRRTQD
jgi:hypothetical protein